MRPFLFLYPFPALYPSLMSTPTHAHTLVCMRTSGLQIRVHRAHIPTVGNSHTSSTTSRILAGTRSCRRSRKESAMLAGGCLLPPLTRCSCCAHRHLLAHTDTDTAHMAPHLGSHDPVSCGRAHLLLYLLLLCHHPCTGLIYFPVRASSTRLGDCSSGGQRPHAGGKEEKILNRQCQSS